MLAGLEKQLPGSCEAPERLAKRREIDEASGRVEDWGQKNRLIEVPMSCVQITSLVRERETEGALLKSRRTSRGDVN